MGRLRNIETGQQFELLHHTRIGRSRRCDLSIRKSFVSSEHAIVRYQGDRWTVRDLNSQNGTTLNGVLLDKRADERLSTGARLDFGQREEGWILVDDAPPNAVAFGPHGVRRDAEDGVLTLPDDDRISATVECVDDRWLSDDRGEQRPVIDGDKIIVDGEVWTLSLPHPMQPTLKGDQPMLRMADLILDMRYSGDMQTFETRFIYPGGVIEMGHRAHHRVLRQLAEYLVEDRAAGRAEAGWYPVGLLCEDCRFNRPTLDVYVRRLRQQLFAARVRDANALIERRGGKIRLTPIEVRLHPMA